MQTNEPTSSSNQQTSSPQPTNTPTPQQQPSGVSPPMQELTQGKKPNKWLIIGLVIFALVALGIAGVFAYQNYQLKKSEVASTKELQPTPTSTISVPSPTPTADQTANWETYTSAMLGFTFKYPIEYEPPEERENYLSLISPLNPDRGKGYQLQNGELKVEIVIEMAQEDNSPVRCWSDHSTGEGKILNQSELNFAGINTTIIDWEGHGTGQFICVVHNKRRYLINKYPLETTRQTEFNQILSTFQFTN